MTPTRTAAAFAVAVLLGACSSKTPAPEPEKSSPATTSPAATSSTTAPSTTFTAPSEHGGLSECLQSHGVTDSGGTAIVLGPPAGVDPGTWDTAMKECAALAPGPGPG